MENVPLKRTVALIGKINEGKVMEVSQNLIRVYSESPDECANLVICSEGGASNLGFGLYEYITKIIKPKFLQTIALGSVDSIAPIVLSAGTYRIVGKYCRSFFHHAAKNYNGPFYLNQIDLTSGSRELKKVDELYVQILCERSGSKLKPDILRKWMDKEKTIGASEYIKFGLADEILPV